jgi:hypothetical protein
MSTNRTVHLIGPGPLQFTLDHIHHQDQIAPGKHDLQGLNDLHAAQAPPTPHLSSQAEAHLVAVIPTGGFRDRRRLQRGQ